MENFVTQKLQTILKNYLICFFFSSYIFLWGIIFDFIQLRFFILFLIIPILFNIDRVIALKFLKYFIISTVVVIHYLIQADVIIFKYVFSILIIFFIFIIFDLYKQLFFENLNKVIFFFFIFFFISTFFQFFSYENNLKKISNICLDCFLTLSFFYKENSHFALTAPSVFFYLLFISNFNKFINYFLMIIFLLICILNSSLTLYIGLILLTFLTLCLKIKFYRPQKIVLSFIFFFLIFKFITDDRAVNKVKNFFYVDNKINLSTEVYITSLLVSKNALLNKPFGYGFNNYSDAFDEFTINLNFQNKEVLLLNRNDASNNFSKILTEFGIFSIFFLYFLISFFLSNKIENKIKIFLILPILIQTFIRGAGYFNGGFLLFSFYAFFLWFKISFKNYFLK